MLLQKLIKRINEYNPLELSLKMTEAAVLSAITQNKENPSIVLTRRSLQLEIHAGEVAFPGGKRESSDHSLLQTALRESFEEIWLDKNIESHQ